MNDFYHVADTASRPKIIAVAALPPDRWFHFDSAALKLESALDAKVFGVSDDRRAEILALPDRPNEVVFLYDSSFRKLGTRLFRKLHNLDPSERIFRRHFKAARYALVEVGACASDLVWRRATKEIEANVEPFYEEEEEPQPGSIGSPIKIKNKILDLVKNWAYTMPNLDPSSRGFNVTPKFLRLVQILKSCKVYGEAFRGIIFGESPTFSQYRQSSDSSIVHRRAIAFVIVDLLRTLDEHLRFVRPCAVVGHDPSMRPEQQVVFFLLALSYSHSFLSKKSSGVLPRVLSISLLPPNLWRTSMCPRLLSLSGLFLGFYRLLKLLTRLFLFSCCLSRFDLFESQVSHAYVRARTRGRESHLVHMVERGNDVHRRILSQITYLDASMLHWTEILCNSPGSSIPPRTLRETINPYHSDSEDEDELPEPFIKDPTTSGRIYLQDATTVVYRFAASLGINEDDALVDRPLFEFSETQREPGVPRAHACTIVFPRSPIDEITGPSSFSMDHARRAACYQACVELFQAGFLDYRLFPLPSSVIAKHDLDSTTGTIRINLDSSGKDNLPPQGVDASNKSVGTRCYPCKRPDFWSNTAAMPATTLYPTIISTDHPDEATQAHAPMLILTRQPLPSLASFKLFFSGVTAMVKFRQGASFDVYETQLEDLYLYTLRICRAIANKPFTCSLENMQYLFCPLGLGWNEPMHVDNPDRWDLPRVVDYIPWDLVNQAAETWAVPLKSETVEEMAEDIEGAVIQDRWAEFTRRYDALKVRPDLTPLSKPADSPVRYNFRSRNRRRHSSHYLQREANYENLVEYCKARRKGFEGLKDYTQPLIEVSKVPGVMNHLTPGSQSMTTSSKAPAKCVCQF